jgi:hypothetical protein
MNKESPRATVCVSVGQTAYKRQLAYQRLGIDPNDVQLLPFLRDEFRRIARLINRGLHENDPSASPTRPLDCLRCSEDPEARRVLDVYLSVPESYRRLLPAEAFCKAAGVSPWKVLESIAVVAVRQGAMVSAVIAAVRHPSVVQKTINRALQDDGFRECKMLHKAMGFLPARA